MYSNPALAAGGTSRRLLQGISDGAVRAW